MKVLDQHTIKQHLNLDEATSIIERAYQDYSAGRLQQPPVGHLTFAAVGGDCHIKYGHAEEDDVFVIKVATGFPANAAAGLPVGNGLSLVLSALTGEVIAVLHDEMYLTDVRTAIGGAVASRILARSDAKKLLIVGTGTQAHLQAASHLQNMRDLETVTYWGRHFGKADAISKRTRTTRRVTATDDLKRACSEADIIVTATASTEPLIDNDWIQPGTHITAVGADAPGKCELMPSLMERADVLIADSKAQCLDHGDFSKLRSEVASSVREFGQILSGHETGRTSATQITIADLTGIAALDIAIAKHVLRKISG